KVPPGAMPIMRDAWVPGTDRISRPLFAVDRESSDALKVGELARSRRSGRRSGTSELYGGRSVDIGRPTFATVAVRGKPRFSQEQRKWHWGHPRLFIVDHVRTTSDGPFFLPFFCDFGR